MGAVRLLLPIFILALLVGCGRPPQRQNLSFDSTGGDPAAGQALYFSTGGQCVRCHGSDGRGGDYPVDIRFTAPSRIAAALRTGPSDMPQYTLSDQAILNLIAFINTL